MANLMVHDEVYGNKMMVVREIHCDGMKRFSRYRDSTEDNMKRCKSMKKYAKKLFQNHREREG